MSTTKPQQRSDGAWFWHCPVCGAQRRNQSRDWVKVAAEVHLEAAHSDDPDARHLDAMPPTGDLLDLLNESTDMTPRRPTNVTANQTRPTPVTKARCLTALTSIEDDVPDQVTAISEATGYPHATVTATMHVLTMEESVVRVGPGRWEVAS